MNRYELDRILQERDVPLSHYYIDGVSSGARESGQGMLVLSYRDPDWVVYSYDRGNEAAHRQFSSEAAACAWMFEQLTQTRPPPLVLSPEEIAAAERQGQRDVDPSTGQGPREFDK
jgi:hypothetical protein